MPERLNERKAAELKPRKSSYEVRDTVVRGLVLRVGAKGQKVWEAVTADGKGEDGKPKRKRTRLGLFPDLSVAEARKQAEALKSDLIRPGSARGITTVGELFDRYARANADRLRSFHDVESVWRIWGAPSLSDVRLSDLSVYHGIDLRDRIAAKSSPTRASSAIRVLRPMMKWAASEGYLPANPWIGLRPGQTAQERDRVLIESEWRRLWEAAHSLEYPFGPWIAAMMLSAQRLSNVAQMEWAEIAGDVWVIPKQKMKSTRPDRAKTHEVPLSGALADLIARQPRRGAFVFTSDGDKAIVPGSKLKKKVSEIAGLSDWRWHDVRRTGATRMAEGGVSRFLIERTLGHSDGSVTAIYDRSAYRKEKRAALEVLATTLPIKSSSKGSAING